MLTDGWRGSEPAPFVSVFGIPRRQSLQAIEVDKARKMYAVIFQAEFSEQDREYAETAKSMRERAIKEYGCLEFVSVCEGNTEISISYWASEEQIKRWKNDSEHLIAQRKGKERWYRSYRIQVTEIKRAYHNNTQGNAEN